MDESERANVRERLAAERERQHAKAQPKETSLDKQAPAVQQQAREAAAKMQQVGVQQAQPASHNDNIAPRDTPGARQNYPAGGGAPPERPRAEPDYQASRPPLAERLREQQQRAEAAKQQLAQDQQPKQPQPSQPARGKEPER